MADKKINELTALTDPQVNDDARVFPLADISTGVARMATIGQLRLALATKRLNYTSDNTEGSTLTITALAGKDILFIIREFGLIFEVVSAPGSTDYTWDGTDIVLGTPVSGSNERFLIVYIN